MTATKRLFLAHASEDKPAVRELYHELKARGFVPWLDSEDLLPGQVWKIEIPKAIRGASVFLACLSTRSVAKRGYVQKEFRTALTTFGELPPGSIYLIPVRLDECEVPDLQIPDLGLGLRDVHWVDLFAEDGLDRLVRSLTDGAGIAPSEHATRTGPVPLQVFRDVDAPWCPELVVIPAGRFVMGSSPNEEGRYDGEDPRHFVIIAEPFALGRYPVTFEEYDAFAAATGRGPADDESWGRGRRPVINVSWDDAQAYVDWLSEQTGQPYRLPSEAGWEYAARAGTTTPFHFGPTISTDQANYNGNYIYGFGQKGIYREQTTAVGSFEANAFGLHDMHGNVWEWCADVWHDSYEGAPPDGTPWLDDGYLPARCLRGGSLHADPVNVRSARRDLDAADNRLSFFTGFRVARTLR